MVYGNVNWQRQWTIKSCNMYIWNAHACMPVAPQLRSIQVFHSLGAFATAELARRVSGCNVVRIVGRTTHTRVWLIRSNSAMGNAMASRQSTEWEQQMKMLMRIEDWGWRLDATFLLIFYCFLHLLHNLGESMWVFCVIQSNVATTTEKKNWVQSKIDSSIEHRQDIECVPDQIG